MKDIILKRNSLGKLSKQLREVSMQTNFDKSTEMREQQDKIFKKFKFYDGFIKTMNKGDKNE